MKTKMVFALLCALIIMSGWLMAKWFRNSAGSNNMTAQSIEKMIAAEISPKASRLQVEAWLDAKKIKHQYYDKMEYRGLKRVVVARVDKTTQNFLTEGFTTITFFFDKEGKLTRYEVKEIFTGP